MTEEQLLTVLTHMKSQLQTIASALAAVENQQGELLDALPKLQSQIGLTGEAITALADEFVPLGRRAAAMLNGTPLEKARAAMGKNSGKRVRIHTS